MTKVGVPRPPRRPGGTPGQFNDFDNRRRYQILGGAAVWPLAVSAQRPAMPVIGYLDQGAPETSAVLLAAFRKGLSETGYVEGRNVAIEYRWAHNDFDRLPELAADLVRRRVDLIVIPGSTPAALAAKAATTTVPIVFATGADPVQFGLVASLNRPGGNVTGINTMNEELGPKRLGRLQELLPGAARFALLVDPNAATFAATITNLQAAAAGIGRQIEVLTASTNREIDAAFASLVQKRIEALLVSPHALFRNRRVQLVTLAAHHRVPTIYPNRDFVESGGLMSYAAPGLDAVRQAGVYVGRILKGEKPADLPVMRPTKFEFIINLQTARTIGIEVPPQLLAIADEVIE
jgi:putative ABC transport system substrate-binding protein